MKVMVNGEDRQIPSGATILSLLDELGLRPQSTAVQQNEVIIDRQKYAETPIGEGDVLELIRIVAGG